MASITIRGLDDDLKQRLRLRAARNGRSMEDEARTILREMAAGADQLPAPSPAADAAPQPLLRAARAAHPPDHRRRHRGL